MNNTSLWEIPSVNTPGDATDNIKEILRQQAQHLKTGTNGKVMAKFSKIVNIATNISNAISVISFDRTEDEETKDLPDANALYRPQRYGFEIYNSSYKFRIFEMNLSPLYPVSIFFDEGVLEDSETELRDYFIEKGKQTNQYVIKSDNELVISLRAVFSSKKVRYILYKLQQV